MTSLENISNASFFSLIKTINSISLHVRLGNTDEYNSIFNQNPSISPHGYINNHTKLPIQLIYRDTMGLPKTSNQNPFANHTQQNTNNLNYFKENIPNPY
ncbi:hypothetical protein CXB51_024226 [Gossypium anomalum]|uniref:Uncharacterized protein n=1 Tax=Gossypium anomalum TaxID=47600 RepID=A0A8J5YIU6_9ROSI|nr:hypothetical protein CXB51_024226 [Gossypium anomalum]